MYDAYGDESVGSDFVAYATILFEESCVTSALAVLADVKARFGGSASDVLHSRILFSGNQRKKSVWAPLSVDDVFTLYSELTSRICRFQSRNVVAIAKKKEFPEVLPGGQWQYADPNFIGPMPWSKGHGYGEKHIASHCAQATMIPISKWPGLDQVRFWPDPDATRIELTDGSRQFSRTLGGFVDNGGQEPAKINLMAVVGEKPPLLEVADMAAYVAQRAATGKYSPNDRKFKSLHDLIGAEMVTFGIAPDGALGINVPNASLEFRPK
jgi:hypothetical protein